MVYYKLVFYLLLLLFQYDILCYGGNTLTSQREMSKINKMVQIILKEKVISKVQLIMRSGISISYYEKLKPFMEELYENIIQYDKELKLWKSLEK